MGLLGWALIFLLVALVAGGLGFGGVARGAAGVARVLAGVFLVLFLALLFLNVLG